MPAELTRLGIPAFTKACAYERVFGSKILTALRAYGIGSTEVKLYLYEQNKEPLAALCLAEGVLTVSCAPQADPAPIADFARKMDVKEVDTNWEQCQALQSILGGTCESSYYMVYQGPPVEEAFPLLFPGELHAVFSILQRSHEYYRQHLQFDVWHKDLIQKLDRGLMELYQLEYDGEIIGTGSIISEDDQCGVIAAVAIVPEHRHRGWGSYISKFLVRRILEKGKTPRLISGYDEVAELYRKIGFAPCGRWGELYL
ncbi:MAG: GNAT family N-acetyltransferase [Angelakisella sp.]|nr:GNAT family N-acetyltransferase [Angelakisella sp.]